MESRPLLLLTPQRVGWGQGVGRGHSQDSWPQLTTAIFCTMGCHAQHFKAGGRRRKGGTFGMMTFVFPSNHYAWRSPAFLGMTERCLPMGSGEWIPRFALRHFTYWTVRISTHKLSHFCPSDSLPDPTVTGVSERLCGAELAMGVKPWHQLLTPLCLWQAECSQMQVVLLGASMLFEIVCLIVKYWSNLQVFSGQSQIRELEITKITDCPNCKKW